MARIFRGIPYAQPPVGDLRWYNPQPVEPWGPNPLDASSYKPGCPQICELPPHNCPDETSEDCLYLNIFTPLGVNQQSLLPVMFFIHGGNFRQGVGSSVLYEGEFMVNTSNVILVTINYRLGALGFLTTDNFGGNFGFYDQRVALQWVQTNIKSFGGDPSQVTIFGQSAGGTSVACHLVSPISAGLFNKAIIESNPFTLTLKTEQEQRDVTHQFLKDIGCRDGDDICLQQKTVDEILIAQNKSQATLQLSHPLYLFYPWTPRVGDNDIPLQPLDAFSKGLFTKVPIMLGTVRDEALLFIYMADSKPITDVEYYALLAVLFKFKSYDVLEFYKQSAKQPEFQERLKNLKNKYYPQATAHDNRPLVSVMGTDYILLCSTRNAAASLVLSGVPTYLYEFDHVPSFDPWGPKFEYCNGKVCHGTELPFVFHNVHPFYNFTAAEDSLSRNMVAYWTNFAKTGNPNSPQQVPVNWPTWDANLYQDMKLTTPPAVDTKYRINYCDFWDQMGYNWGT